MPKSRAPVACLPDGFNDLYAIAGPPLLACAQRAHRCIAIDLATGHMTEAAFVAAPNTREVPHATMDGGKLCFAGTCKPLKKYLQHAVHGETVTGTTDLAAVVIGADNGPVVWSVDRDRPILGPTARDQMTFETAVAIDHAIYTEWSPPEAAVYSSSGKLVASELPGESKPPVPLDGSRWYVLTKMHRLELFDGTAHRSVDFAHDAGLYLYAGAVALPEGKIAVVSTATVYIVDIATAAVTRTWPLCAH